VITFRGIYFDGVTSRAREVTVNAGEQELIIEEDGGGAEPEVIASTQCIIEPPLGSGVRMIRFKGRSGHIETTHAAAVAQLEKLTRANSRQRLLHRLESGWKTALIALVLSIISLVSLAQWGVPMLADRIALAIPEEALTYISRETLEQLDKGYLDPSELDQWEKDRVVEKAGAFAARAGLEEPTISFRSFRHGPNAFALPSGTIVLTDELVRFVDDDDELMGVLAHEMAHQTRRHAIRGVLRNMGVFLLISYMMGDVTSTVAAGAAVPTYLISTGYSREFELEADFVGATYMRRADVPVEALAEFMDKMAEKYPDRGVPDFLSTHPDSGDRAEYLRELSNRQ